MKSKGLKLISTGSRSLDELLGGGIHGGMISDIYGESGSGKTQLCFNVALNCARNGGKVIFVDSAGTFRPERIVEIGGSREFLERITYVRPYATDHQESAVRRIFDVDMQLLIVDTVTSLYSAEFSGPARHLAVMKHLHELAVGALISGCAVVVTNMIRNVPSTISSVAGGDVAQANTSQQVEFLGSSVSIYTHFKLKLEIVDPNSSTYRARLMQPPGRLPVEFRISSSGVSDLD